VGARLGHRRLVGRDAAGVKPGFMLDLRDNSR